MKRKRGFHWLATLGVVPAGEGRQLETAVKIAKSVGSTLFELACAPVNGLTAAETADAVIAGGMDTVSFCRFIPDDGTFGDPLGDEKASGLALETFEGDLAFIAELQKKGLTVSHITGPSCFRLGEKYEGLSATDKHDRLLAYIGKQAERVCKTDLILALEYLRPGEDFAIESFGSMIKLLVEIGHPQVGWHCDVFHTLERKENLFENVRHSGDHLKYLHAHSQSRVAPGAFYLDDNRAATDNVNWWLLGQYLDRREFTGPVTPEPFGQAIRDAVPVLGEGLPPAIDPTRYYTLAFGHLEKMGLI